MCRFRSDEKNLLVAYVAAISVRKNVYSLSILKRQLERGRDVLLHCQMSHVYMIIFLIILIFLLEIFFKCKK